MVALEWLGFEPLTSYSFQSDVVHSVERAQRISIRISDSSEAEAAVRGVGGGRQRRRRRRRGGGVQRHDTAGEGQPHLGVPAPEGPKGFAVLVVEHRSVTFSVKWNLFGSIGLPLA